MATVNGQVVLEEQIDRNYVPSDQEIFEYAQWLGMDVEREKELLWIAKQGLKAPLPPNWKPCTGESIWDHPCDEQFRKLYEEEKAKFELRQQQGRKLSQPQDGPNPKDQVARPAGAGDVPAASTALPSAKQSASVNPAAAQLLAVQLQEERLAMEQRLKASFEAERAELEGQYRARLQQMRAELEDEEQVQKRKMVDATDLLVAEYKKQMEAREAREKEEITLEHKRQLLELEEGYSQLLASLKKEKEQLEEQLRGQISAAKRNLEDSSSLAELEVSSMRARAISALEEESRLWAEAQKVMIRQRKLEEATQQVDAELAPLRAAKREEALRTLGHELEAAAAAKREEVAELEAKAAGRSAELLALDLQMAEKKAQAAALDAGVDSRSMQLPSLEAEVQAKQQELARVDRCLGHSMGELQAAAAKLREQQQQLAGVGAELAAMQAEVSEVASELHSKQVELGSIRKQAALEASSLSTNAAEHGSTAQLLSDTTAALADRQQQLAAAEKLLEVKLAELAAAGVELARQRADAVTKDVSMAAELRARAAAEYQQLEVQLTRSRQDLESVTSELDDTSHKLTSRQDKLQQVERDLAEKRRQAEDTAAELNDCQIELAEVERELAEKRVQLQRVATRLFSCQKDLEQEALRRPNLSGEEEELLKAALAHMEDSVAEQVAEQRHQLLGSQLAAMRAEVDQLVAAERAALSSSLRQHANIAHMEAQLAAAMQRSSTAQPDEGVTVPSTSRADPTQPKTSGTHPVASPHAGHTTSNLQDRPPTLTVTRHDSWPAPGTQQQGRAPKTSQAESPHLPGGLSPSVPSRPGLLPPAERLYQSLDLLLSRAAEAADAGATPGRKKKHSLGQHGWSMLAKAKFFLKQQKAYIRERQAMVKAAREEWKASMAETESHVDLAQRTQQLILLQQVKASLEEQIHRVNADAAQLAQMKQLVSAAEQQQAANCGEAHMLSTTAMEDLAVQLRQVDPFSTAGSDSIYSNEEAEGDVLDVDLDLLSETSSELSSLYAAINI